MVLYVVNHKVNDFAVWKKVYDEFESTREQCRLSIRKNM